MLMKSPKDLLGLCSLFSLKYPGTSHDASPHLKLQEDCSYRDLKMQKKPSPATQSGHCPQALTTVHLPDHTQRHVLVLAVSGTKTTEFHHQPSFVSLLNLDPSGPEASWK